MTKQNKKEEKEIPLLGKLEQTLKIDCVLNSDIYSAFKMGLFFTWGVFGAIGQLLLLIKIYEFITK